MLSVEEARKRILDAFEVLQPEDLPLDQASGRALARDVFAPHALPRFDNSAMDGYAVRNSDLAQLPVRLRVIGEVAAGRPGDIEVTERAAVRIMTGAPVPAGADAVVPVELTYEAGEHVDVVERVGPGANIRPAGDDLQQGELMVAAGTELRAGELALLGSSGISPVAVVRRPKVAVVVTGDELVAPEASPGPGQIRDSNSIALRTLVADAGAQPILLPNAGDDRAQVRTTLARAAEISDLVVSSGGVAVGKYDYVKAVVEELGAIELWKVAMQPGKPVVLGTIGAIPFLGLPGNPVSVHVCFEQFVRPAIRKMRGCRNLLAPELAAKLTRPLTKKPGRSQFVRVRLHAAGETWEATPTGRQGSHIQSSLVDCHGVARFPADATRLSAGELVTVEVWRLPESPA